MEQKPESKKKKGFLPETKKRKKRQKPVLEPAAEQSTPKDKLEVKKGQAKKKQDQKSKPKRPADGAADTQPNPAKKKKIQPENRQEKKKNKKQKKRGGQMWSGHFYSNGDFFSSSHLYL